MAVQRDKIRGKWADQGVGEQHWATIHVLLTDVVEPEQPRMAGQS